MTGQITGNNSSGFLINGGNSGLGSVRLSNATSTFSVPITVVMGSLLVANNVAVSGASALGTIASVSLADGATPTFATSFDSNPAFLIDGAFTVNRGVSLANAASSGAPNSYVIGGNTAAVSSLVGNVTVGSTVPDKLLNLTQATGGTFTHSGVINPNADSTGKLNVEINAPKGLSSGSNAGNYQFSRNAGTVVLTGNSTYDGSTTVSAGTLQVSGSISGSSNVVVNTGSTLLFGGTTVTDRINNSAPVNLNGGTLLTAGFSETTGILTLTGTNVIDMGGGASVLQFANSSGALWGGSLMVWNWSGTATGGGTDQLRFGNSGAGLTTTPQVASVSFLDPAGFAAGTYPATLLGSGELVPVPEPSALFTAGTALAAAFRRRRR